MFKCLSTIRHSSLLKQINYSIKLFPFSRMSAKTKAGVDESAQLSLGPGLLSILENRPTRLKRIKFLAQLFQSSGFELRIAGGAVRDILRGIEPKDIDFATTARPEQSLELVKKHEDLMRIIVTPAGQKHGTIAVKFKEVEFDMKRIKLNESSDIAQKYVSAATSKPEYDEESPYEITTLRCDNLTDGRHAEVEFISDWKIDAERRDLTINAMFLTLDEGKLIDYFDGASDLKNGIVRFVGDADKRIKEDYLRILRFFRFWSLYGRKNQPDTETFKKLENNLSGLEIISGERIWQEIKKTFTVLPFVEVVELMLKLKLPIHIRMMKKDVQNYDKYMATSLEQAKQVQTNIEHYIKNATKLKNPKEKKLLETLPALAFASIIQTPEMCLDAYKRLKFSNLERDSIIYIIENRKKIPTIETLKRIVALANKPEQMPILQKTKAYLIYQGQFDCLRDLESWIVPVFPNMGTLVSKNMKARGLPPSKTKVVLDFLKNQWADSDYKLTAEDLELKLCAKLEELTI